MYSSMSCLLQLLLDNSLYGWWQSSVLTYVWKYECYGSAHNCVWRTVVPKSWRLNTAQVLWSDTRRCFIHEKEMFTEIWYVEVMQSKVPVEVRSSSVPLKADMCVYVYNTEHRGLHARWWNESVTVGTTTCISWWEGVFLTKHTNAALSLLLRDK